MGTGNGLNSRTMCNDCGSELHETELFLGNWPLLSLSNIFPVFYNPQAHFCVQKNTPLDHIQSHANSVHISHPTHLRSIRLLSFHWHFRCNKQNIHIFHLPRACYNVPPISPPSSDCLKAVAYQGILFGGGRGDSTNSVEDRENGDLEAVAP